MSTNCESWRTSRPHKPNDPGAMRIPFPATKFFDNLSFIGNDFVGCFLLETSEGLIMLDNMEPGDAKYIEQGILDLGYDPQRLRYILISHGHADHYGSADYFREKYGTKLFMSKIDEEIAMDPATPRPPQQPPMPFRMDGHLEDQGIFRCGDTEIKLYHTPGHTPGCISFIFDVYDEGRCHRASLWGGTGVPRNMEDRKTLLKSCDSFAVTGMKEGCDVAISTHPFVDNSFQRLEVVRQIVDGVANPFVIGYEGYHRFETMYHDMYASSLKDSK